MFERLNELSWTTLISIILVLIMVILNLKDRKKKQLVGYVSKLYTYPVKSTMRVDLKEMEITNLGPKHDRQFTLLNEHGTFMSLRRYPKLVLVRVSIQNDGIYLEADDMPPLKLPLEMKEEDGDHINPDINIWRKSTAGVHVSKDADDWFAKYLNVTGCKLYCFPKGGKPRYAEDKGVQVPNYTNEKDTCMFADGTPILLLSETSVEDFKTKFSCENLTVERFRPNIVITGSQCFQEDDWPNVEIGNVKLQNLYPCDRCVAVNVDPFTGEVSKDVLPAVQKHHVGTEKYHALIGHAIFGCNYGVRTTGTIKSFSASNEAFQGSNEVIIYMFASHKLFDRMLFKDVDVQEQMQNSPDF